MNSKENTLEEVIELKGHAGATRGWDSQYAYYTLTANPILNAESYGSRAAGATPSSLSTSSLSVCGVWMQVSVLLPYV
jgi:hypothetical protein